MIKITNKIKNIFRQFVTNNYYYVDDNNVNSFIGVIEKLRHQIIDNELNVCTLYVNTELLQHLMLEQTCRTLFHQYGTSTYDVKSKNLLLNVLGCKVNIKLIRDINDYHHVKI